MNNITDKNIKSNNSELMRDKQIEEMANVINEMDEPNAHYYGKHMKMHEAFADCFTIAKHLYAKGYRKQSNGEWVTNAWDGNKWIIIPYDKHEHIGAHCSVCNKRALLNYNKDEVTSNFCPNCGAKMKGE